MTKYFLLAVALPLALLPEKFGKDLPAFRPQDASLHFRRVIEFWIAQQIPHRPRHPRLLIPCPEPPAIQPREHDRARAHRARLEGHVEGAPRKPLVAKDRRGGLDGEELGGGGGGGRRDT